jgi:cytochrome c5
MTMKPFLPFLTVGLFFLGACGLEKPPASLKFPDAKSDAAPAAAPVAAPAKEEVPADPKLAAGKTVYDANCGACHEAAMMGAPKPGDVAAWAPRIAQGIDVMTKKSITGFTGKAGTMPPKGGNASLTDEEVTNAVAFMADKSKGATPTTEAPAADPKLAGGKTLYDANCAACHESGMMGAPKPGDKAAWAPRIAQGNAVLVSHAVKGFLGKVGMMPAKGGKATLTDAEITSIVTYMADKSK